jgi:prevent-host-death family protein
MSSLEIDLDRLSLEVYTSKCTLRRQTMKTATAKDLRNRASAILARVRKGDEVVITMRGKSIAVMKPMSEIEKSFSPIGFGIWKGRKEMTDVKKWVDERRKERYLR